MNQSGMIISGVDDEAGDIDLDDPYATGSNPSLLNGNRRRSQLTTAEIETNITVAIDEFMRSPRSVTQNRLGYTNSNDSQVSISAAANASQRRPGVCVAKSYQMLCGRCGRRFTSK